MSYTDEEYELVQGHAKNMRAENERLREALDALRDALEDIRDGLAPYRERLSSRQAKNAYDIAVNALAPFQKPQED